MNIDDIEKVKQGAVAKVLGISERQVRTLTKNGTLQQCEPRRYSLPDCVARYIRFKGADTPDSYIASQKALADARTRQLEFKNGVEERRLIPTADVVQVGRELAGLIARHLESQPDRMASILAGTSDAAKVRELLMTENRRIRRQLAEDAEAMAHPKEDEPPPSPFRPIVIESGDDKKPKGKAARPAKRTKKAKAANRKGKRK